MHKSIKYGLILFLLSFNLIKAQKDNYFNDEVAHTGEINSSENFELNPNHLDKVVVNFKALEEYYRNEGVVYIKKGEVAFLDLNQNPIKVDIDKVEFILDSKDSTIVLDMPVSPESSQKLFELDEEKYIDFYGGEDFLSAKINSYQVLSFSIENQNYSKRYYQLWDWKSLNHPPIRKLSHELKFYDRNKPEIDFDALNSPFFSSDFHDLVDNNTNSELSFNNEIEILENSNSYRKKIELIKNAKSSILISVMSYYRDSSSLQMTNELIKKANEGVTVYLIVEKVWTKLLMKKALTPMKRSNINVIYADDLLKQDASKRALFHNKFWVVDGVSAIVGGQNIIDSDNISTGFNHQSRDCDMFVKGPVVSEIALSFVDLLEKYNYEKKVEKHEVKFIENYKKHFENKKEEEIVNKLRGQEIYKEKLQNKNTRMKGVCRFIIQGPQADEFAVSKAYLSYFKKTQNSIDLTTGKINFNLERNNSTDYPVDTGWSERIWDQLIESAESGVEVNLISNGIDGGYGELGNYLKRKILENPDNSTITEFYPGTTKRLDIKAARRNFPFLNYLQEIENFNTWMSFQYMHSKTFLLDRIVVSVGSFNLDPWSSDKSHESVLICQDKDLVKQYENQFILDKVNSTPVFVKK